MRSVCAVRYDVQWGTITTIGLQVVVCVPSATVPSTERILSMLSHVLHLLQLHARGLKLSSLVLGWHCPSCLELEARGVWGFLLPRATGVPPCARRRRRPPPAPAAGSRALHRAPHLLLPALFARPAPNQRVTTLARAGHPRLLHPSRPKPKPADGDLSLSRSGTRAPPHSLRAIHILSVI